MLQRNELDFSLNLIHISKKKSEKEKKEKVYYVSKHFHKDFPRRKFNFFLN